MDDNEKVKKSNRFNKQNNNFAQAPHFFVNFLSVFARLRRENALFRVYGGRKQATTKYLFLFLSLDMVIWNSASEGFAYVGRNNHYKDWKNANSLFKRPSRCRRVVKS